MNELQDKFDKLWTELEQLRVDVAIIKTIVANDHEHRLKRLENLLWFLIGSVLAGSFLHFVVGVK